MNDLSFSKMYNDSTIDHMKLKLCSWNTNGWSTRRYMYVSGDSTDCNVQ